MDLFHVKKKQKKPHVNIYRHVWNHACNIIHLSAPHPQSTLTWTRLLTLCFRTEMEVCSTWTGENIYKCLDHSVYWAWWQTVINVFYGQFVIFTKFPGRPRDKTSYRFLSSLRVRGLKKNKKQFGPQYLSPTKSSIFYALLRRGVSGDGVLLRQKNLARRWRDYWRSATRARWNNVRDHLTSEGTNLMTRSKLRSV